MRNLSRNLLTFAILSSTPVLADHPTVAFGTEGGSAINTISASTMPAGSWAVGLRTEVIDNEEFSTEELEDFATAGEEGVHTLDKITSTSLSIAHGLTDNITISARLPHIKRAEIREGELEMGVPEAHTHGDSSGIGDLLLFGQYHLPQSASFETSILAGIKVPTGEDGIEDDGGVRFETEFQPGTGSWDFLLGGAISKQMGKIGLHANILYNKTTEGSQSSKIGDAFSYNAALTYRLGKDKSDHNHSTHDHTSVLHLDWDASLELNGETRQEDGVDGSSEEHSGGTIIFVAPGVRVSSGKFSGFLSIGIPLIENTNGEQADIDTRVVAGISIAL